MKWLEEIVKLFNSIIDRLPSRRESLLNQRDAYKQELYELQFKKPFDHVRYSTTASKLQSLEARISNAGGIR